MRVWRAFLIGLLPLVLMGTAYTVTTYFTSLTLSGQLTLLPKGTGAGEGGSIKLQELAANGTDAVILRSPDSVTSSATWEVPATDGTAGQRMVTNGSNQISWANDVVTILSAYPNGVLTTNTVYAGYVLPAQAFTANAVMGYVSVAGVTGTLNYEIYDGSNTCTCSVACTGGTTSGRAACSGSCAFASGASLVLRTKNAADCGTYPTVLNLEVEGTWQ